jgi:uncharacterized protein YndB with AHSA1/START domain
MNEVFTSSLEINAPPEDVFDYFLKPELLVRWMGEFARLEAVSGGLFSVDIDGVLIRGEYVSIQRPHLIEIAWGEAGNNLMPPGSTQLQIVLQPSANGTTLTLTHSGLEESEAKKHAFGWPHFLARLAIAAAGGEPGPYPWAKNGA